MLFDDFDKKMRVYETGSDSCVLPEMFFVARLDGRSFTKLTKEVMQFEAPYDVRFRDMMVETTTALMKCGFNIRFAYIQSDEISLLFDRAETQFNRKLRKFNSVLAAEASARFSLLAEKPATFDCRISQLPNEEIVFDYFRWRSADALRNSLNSHCYWALRKSGLSGKQATRRMVGLSTAGKNNLLFEEFDVNFNDLPTWQKRGVGIYWKLIEKDARNRMTGAVSSVQRRQIFVDFELPAKSDLDELLAGRMA